MKRTVAIALVILMFGIPTVRAGVKEDFQKARQYYREGKYAEALVLFKKVAKKRKKNAQVRYFMALCHLKQKNWDAAIRMADEALTRNPEMIKAFLAKADAYIGKEAYDTALEVLAAALEKAPENPDLHFTRGLALSHKEDYAGAIEAFKKVLEKQPQRAYAHYYLGLSYYYSGKKAHAIESLQRFLDLAPDAPEAPMVRELLKRLQG